MPTALVTGATGIAGQAIVQHLLALPEWTKVIALSRTQKPDPNPKLVHANIDLRGNVDSIADSLKDVGEVNYVFFCAYLADPDPSEAAKINSLLLENFIDALRASGTIKSLKRFLIVNGLKQYGVHYGQTKQPMQESDPRVEGGSWPPNFYYKQQDILIEAAKQDQGRWSWVVTHPQDIIGVAKGNFMNLATALGLYASVSASLPGGEMPFPGAKTAYLAFNCWTSAKLHAEFCVWACLHPEAANNAFNVVNGDTESWQNLWPRLVERYGGKIPAVMFPRGDSGNYGDYEAWHTVTIHTPAIAMHEERMGLKGDYINSHNLVNQQIDSVKWMQRPEIRKKWEELRDRFDLSQETWDKATWRFITFLLGRQFSCVVSMSKARKMGWTGYQDTWESFEETLSTLEDEGILPPASKLTQATTKI